LFFFTSVEKHLKLISPYSSPNFKNSVASKWFQERILIQQRKHFEENPDLYQAHLKLRQQQWSKFHVTFLARLRRWFFTPRLRRRCTRYSKSDGPPFDSKFTNLKHLAPCFFSLVKIFINKVHQRSDTFVITIVRFLQQQLFFYSFTFMAVYQTTWRLEKWISDRHII